MESVSDSCVSAGGRERLTEHCDHTSHSSPLFPPFPPLVPPACAAHFPTCLPLSAALHQPQSGMEPLTERARNLTEVAEVGTGRGRGMCWVGAAACGPGCCAPLCTHPRLTTPCRLSPSWRATPSGRFPAGMRDHPLTPMRPPRAAPCHVPAGKDAHRRHRGDAHPRGGLSCQRVCRQGGTHGPAARPAVTSPAGPPLRDQASGGGMLVATSSHRCSSNASTSCWVLSAACRLVIVHIACAACCRAD